jgi:hypothetical protein
MYQLQDAIELLDRQHSFMQRQEGERLLLQTHSYLGVLGSDPRIYAHLADLQAEGDVALDEFDQHQRDVVRALVPLRQRLVKLVPKADDSDLPAPAQSEVEARMDFVGSLANFDATAAAIETAAPPPRFEGNPSDSAVDTLIWILYEKLNWCRWQTEDGTRSSTDLAPELAPVEEAVASVAGPHRRVQRALLNRIRTHAAFGVLRLQQVAAETGEALAWLDADERLRRWHNVVLRVRYGPLALALVTQWLHPESGMLRSLAAADTQALVASIRDDVDVVHEELRRRIGTTRSRLALIHRYRTRSEWYDYAELRELASKTAPEAALTRHLARYLFDAGLSPITKPLAGRLEPDLLDPALSPAFYVEAKQYSGSAHDALKRGLWQVHDTLATLRATQYEVREGFYVVFRRAGPRYILPAQVPGEGWAVYPVLVDIAEDVGSRARQAPIEISLSEILEARPTS